VQEESNVSTQANISATSKNNRSSNAPSAPTETKEPTLEASEQAGSNHVPETPGVAGDEEDETISNEKTALTISGAVLDDSGMLLPNIIVIAIPALPSRTSQETTQSGNEVSAQITDHLGGFTFENLTEGEYELTVAQDEQHYPVTLRVRAGVANAELVLQRIRSIRIHGLITDEEGVSLEGVEVRILGADNKVLSGISGAYSILTGPGKAGQAPVIDFSLKDYRDSRQRVESALNPMSDEVELNVRMKRDSDTPKVVVSGQVSGPTGEVVSGVWVWLSSSELQTYERTRSSATGEYQFRTVEVGDAYVLGVDPGEEYAAFKSEFLSIGPGDLYYDVRLDAAGFSNLSGTVTDLGGKPLGNFTLWLRSIDVASHPMITIHTDGAGGFRLERVPSGSIKLESRSQPWLEASGIILRPGESRHVELPLDWGQDWLLGQVVDEAGEPVARAQVTLRWTRNYADISSKSRREVMSDQGGYFALSNLDAQEYVLTVNAAGYESYRVQYRPDQGGQEVLVKLPRRISMAQVLTGGD
jgi:protocatechuate 3,4-dioxygenase beta subunit